jgi:hypothetical protein
MAAEQPSEDLLGVIWAPCIRYGGGLGYGLVVTSGRIIGARKTPWLHGFFGYLGPGSKVSPDIRAKGEKAAAELMAEKEFELQKDSISKILFKDPGLFSGGHVIFKTDKQDIQIDITNPPGDATTARVTPQLKASVAQFAPDRMYNEETGVLVKDEAYAKLAKKEQEKQQKKHWW